MSEKPFNDPNFNPYQSPQSDFSYDDDDEVGALLDEPNSLSIGQGANWIGQSWQIFKERPLLWIGSILFFWFSTILLSVLANIPYIGLFFSIGLGISNFALLAGLAYLAYGIDNGLDISFGDLFTGFSYKLGDFFIMALIYFGLWILVAFIAIVPIILVAGTNISAMSDTTIILAGLIVLLLIIPIFMMIWFAPALILLNDLKPFEAMKLSFKGCLRNILPFLVYGILMSLVAFVAAIPLGLGLFVAIPMTFIAIYISYKEIFLANG